jgi:hypothetical protein
VGNQARGGRLAGRNANMAYRQVRRLSGRRAGLRAADAPAPRLPEAPKPSACIDRLPGPLELP